MLRLHSTWINRDDDISKKFADSLEERFKLFELVTDEETAVTEAFNDVPSCPAF